MKRFVPCCLILCLVLAAAPLAAKDTQPQFNTIVVKRFVNANGVNRSQEFIDAFSNGFRAELEKGKFAGQVIAEDGTVADAVAANSLSIEGKFTAFSGGIKYVRNADLHVEINIYRIRDHVLIKTTTVSVGFEPGPGDRKEGEKAGQDAAYQPIFKHSLKNIDLSSIPESPPFPSSAPPAPASATATSAAPVFASVQLSSNPAGAEITIGGAYAGNTPSLIKLRPGTHSIRIAKDGYTPWEQSIETGAGESRNLAPNLEKTGP